MILSDSTLNNDLNRFQHADETIGSLEQEIQTLHITITEKEREKSSLQQEIQRLQQHILDKTQSITQISENSSYF